VSYSIRRLLPRRSATSAKKPHEAYFALWHGVTRGRSTWVADSGWEHPPHLPVQYAEQYVAALNDPRFPTCDTSKRSSTRLKQLWFLSRALAGAVFGVKPRTAINLVGSMRPEQVFQEARAGKPARKTRRTSHKPRTIR